MAAERKPLFMGTEGFAEETAQTDYLTIAKLTIPVAGSGGVGIIMGSNKITGVGSAEPSGIGSAQTRISGVSKAAAIAASRRACSGVVWPKRPR